MQKLKQLYRPGHPFYLPAPVNLSDPRGPKVIDAEWSPVETESEPEPPRVDQFPFWFLVAITSSAIWIIIQCAIVIARGRLALYGTIF